MTDLHTQLCHLVFAAIDDLNEQRPPHERLEKSLDTPLTGDEGTLDSLAFVNLIVALEQHLERAFGVPVSLLDDERLDPTAGQFRTVRALVGFLEKIRPAASNV